MATVILAGGKLIDAPSVCNRLIRKLKQQPTFTMGWMALSLRCYVLISESQGLSTAYSAWVTPQLPKDLYVEAETCLWGTKIFNSSLAFENGISEEELKRCWYSIAFMKGNLINKRPMSKSISEDGVFMHSTLSKFCVNASKFELVELLFEEIEGNIVLVGYGKKFMCERMENILCSGMQCSNCKLAGWTMKLSLTCFFDYINMIRESGE